VYNYLTLILNQPLPVGFHTDLLAIAHGFYKKYMDNQTPDPRPSFFARLETVTMYCANAWALFFFASLCYTLYSGQTLSANSDILILNVSVPLGCFMLIKTIYYLVNGETLDADLQDRHETNIGWRWCLWIFIGNSAATVCFTLNPILTVIAYLIVSLILSHKPFP
jgi:hypothetical protein